MKVSFVSTVYNEQKTIGPLLKSIANQSEIPDEVIIVDGGSSDDTVKKIKEFKTKIHLNIKLIIKRGNRSVGRNEAIKKATNEIIAISDAGNILDKNWTKNITKPFFNKSVDVVAGYYRGVAKNIFQKCLIPYVLVMPDKANATGEFLPATRSMAIRKSVWKAVGGFDEKLSHNEDYAFACKLKNNGSRFYFAKDAIVNWMPRTNFKGACIMFFRFAMGDMEAGILRTKVVLLFLRYVILFYLLFLAHAYKSTLLVLLIVAGVITYLIWSIKKQFKYVRDLKSIFILPVIQLTADISVMAGSLVGIVKLFLKINYLKLMLDNKFLILIIIAYALSQLSVITWGIPNNHPFTYHMDEWHQLGATKSVVKFGSQATPGGAYGPIFLGLTSAIFLLPFIIIGYVNPFLVKSSVDNLIIQQHLFELLRLHIFLYGVLTIVVIYKIIKNYFSKDWIIGVLIFVLNPLFVLWSNYYKVEIPVTFWITLSFYLFLKYQGKPTLKNLVIAGIGSALALSTKLNALPLILVFILSFVMFNDNFIKKLKNFFIGIGILFGTFFLFGGPDLLFQWKTYLHLITSVIFWSSSNINLNLTWWQIVFFLHYPSAFGYFTIILFAFSLIFWVVLFVYKLFTKQLLNYKKELFIFISFIFFCLSLRTLELGASSSRVLALLPFIAIFITATYQILSSKYHIRRILIIVFAIGFIFQAVQVYSWLYLKFQVPPEVSSSNWILKNIPKGSLIGVENVPIYQGLPDIVLMEFYSLQHNPKQNTRYNYEIVWPESPKLPGIIIVTNDIFFQKLIKGSSKNELIKRLNKEQYVRVKVFSLDYRFNNFFSNEINLYMGNLVPVPAQISIYRKE